MREAEGNVGNDAGDGKRRFKNGDACPWNKEVVCWGYLQTGPWWVSWAKYHEMCKKHGIKPKKKNKTPKKPVHPSKLQKNLLIKFWEYFLDVEIGKHGNRTKLIATTSNADYGLKTEKQRLEKLKEYSNIVIPYKNCLSLREKRKQFNKRKDSLHSPYHFQNSLCFVCKEQAQCRHHIIQLQNGGINSKKNLVSLCNHCHSEIHPWLK